MRNKKAIAVYLDNSDKMDEEFSWLYKTWTLYSLEDEFDLVVYHHPDAKHRLDKYSGVISIEMPYIRLAFEYKFLNSHYFCTDTWGDHLRKYDFLLKTDCDVFLTQNIKGYTPSSFLVGQGGFYDQSDVEKINYIKDAAKELGLEYRYMTLVGSSFFGKTSSVLIVVESQANITEKLLLTNFRKNDQIFDRGIASMIAGEITINHCFTNQHVKLYCLDDKCWEYTKIGSNVLHIHAWHTSQRWSKHSFFRGEYSDWKVNLEDAFSNVANYCHWIATASYDEIISLRKKIAEGSFIPDYKLEENKG